MKPECTHVPVRRIGYLGATNDDHSQNFIHLVESAGGQVCAMRDSQASGCYAPPDWVNWKPTRIAWQRSRRILDQLTGTRDASHIERLLNAIDRNRLEYLVAYWGTRPMGDIIAIKKCRPDLKIILNVLCHPIALSRWKVAAQNWYFRTVVHHCDALLVSSEAMRTYIRRHVVGNRDIPVFMWPPYYSARYFPTSPVSPCRTVPSVLFLGRVDWRRAQSSDNALPFLGKLMDSGIHVYYHYARESATDHRNAHTFAYMPLVEAIRYATQFDASLIMYNLDSCSRCDRFDVTVPDRLVASVSAGVPIAIPAHGYTACKEYLRDYEAVITFHSPKELAERLMDRTAMEHYRRMARENSRKYVGERHMQPLWTLIGSLRRYASNSREPSAVGGRDCGFDVKQVCPSEER